MKEKKKWYLKIPNTYIILFIMILFAALLTWIVPAGEFTRVESEGRMLIENGTYHAVDKSPVNLFDIFVSIPQAAEGSAQIILYDPAFFRRVRSDQFYGSNRKCTWRHDKKTQKAHISSNTLIFVITCLFSCSGSDHRT